MALVARGMALEARQGRRWGREVALKAKEMARGARQQRGKREGKGKAG